MNELIFFIHVIVISLFTVIALKISKESLVAMISIYCILANLFVIKQISLFGYHPTASDAFSVGAILGLNLLQEYYGKQVAKKAIWTCFLALIFYAIVSQIHIAYTPSIYDTSSGYFNAILRLMPRIAIASIGVTIVIQFIDRFFYGFLKTKFNNKMFFLRNIISLFIVQLLDTILFSYAGLYGIVSKMWDIIFISFLVKIAAIIISVSIISIFRQKQIKNSQI